MPSRLRALLASLVLVLATGIATAHASPITYSFTSTGSGSLGSSAFTNALLTVTGTGDTSSIFVSSGAYVIAFDHLDVTIAGLGTAQLSGASPFGGGAYVFATTDTPTVVGFGEAFDSGNANDPLLQGYDLSTPIGPVGGSRITFRGEATSSGALVFTRTATGTFTAAALLLL